MKKMFLLFTIFLCINLYAQTVTSYSIKLGAYTDKNNAIKDQKKIKFDTRIEKGKKYFSLYTGNFTNRQKANKALQKLIKSYKGAYIVKTTTTVTPPPLPPPQKKEVKIKKIKPVKKIIRTTKKIDNLQYGKKYYQQGDYEKAMMSYDRILINNPNNHLVRLEYARTLYMLGFYKNAKKEFHTVLLTNPPVVVQDNIKAYLKKIDSFEKRHYFYGTIGVGIVYDDNLNFNTYMPTTTYGGLLLQNDTNKTEGLYENINLSLMHVYTGEKFSWSNVLYSYNEFQNEDIDNINFLNFISTISKKFNTLQISLPIGVSKTWLDSSSYSFTASTNPTLSFINKSTNFAISLKYKNMEISDDKNKNYSTLGTRVSLIKLFDKLTLYSDGSLEKDERKHQVRYDISKDRVQLSAGAYYQLFKTSLIHIGYQYNFDKYSKTDPTLGYARKDIKNSYNATFKQKLSKSAWAILQLQRVENDSNINSYKYKKNSYALSYQYSF